MAPASWSIANLLLRLPAEYQLAGSTSEDVPLAFPPGGRAIHASYWQPQPARDGGPMHAVAQWPATAAGQAAQVYETDYFMGRQQRVLVTYLRFAAPEAQLMRYATGWARAEFTSTLSQSQIRP